MMQPQDTPPTSLSSQPGSSENVPEKQITPRTIILVEDSKDDQMFAKHTLESLPYVNKVKIANNGQELLDYLEENGFNDRSVVCWNPIMIILDLNMPHVDGFEVLRQIKSDPFTADIPVIVLSSVETTHKIFEAYKLGADGYMTKPLNIEKLECFTDMSWQWPPKDLYY
ncbi:MAG: response regulator [Rhodospirillales bacterium]|nr:response regulator [Rhodospirillales bacterium]MCB9965529.1 response regulator [Rhodospirillales bacterium]